MRSFLNFLKAGRVTLEIKLPDMWIGMFWRAPLCSYCEYAHHVTDVWICIVPCVPLHIRWAEWDVCPEIPF